MLDNPMAWVGCAAGAAAGFLLVCLLAGRTIQASTCAANANITMAIIVFSSTAVGERACCTQAAYKWSLHADMAHTYRSSLTVGTTTLPCARKTEEHAPVANYRSKVHEDCQAPYGRLLPILPSWAILRSAAIEEVQDPPVELPRYLPEVGMAAMLGELKG